MALSESQREFIAICAQVCEAALALAATYEKYGELVEAKRFFECAAFESRLAFAEVQG